MDSVDNILAKLSDLIQQGRFEELESDALEIKPVPAQGGEWKERHKSICAFLNTRGGILILGVREEGTGSSRRYVLSGWKAHGEPKLKEVPKIFTDRNGNVLDLTGSFPEPQLRDFRGDRIAIFYVDELPADRKYAFYEGVAYKRILTGDHKFSGAEIEAQEQFREEARQARELQPVPNLTLNDLDLDKLNKFIFQLNQPVPVETLKPDLDQARPFLNRRAFLKDGAVTVLGALVCAKHPSDWLGFRSHVHGYVDVALASKESEQVSKVVQDKQDFIDNVLQLMESSYGYLLRNIQVGVTTSEGGRNEPQYPSALLRETVNNALAHRDYAIDRQVILTVVPGRHITIQNPGQFRKQLLLEAPNHPIPVHRILPEAKPRNPKLADVLRVYRKWEGRGIGMATLVNLCLQDQIDIPYYQLLTEEVRLYLQAGKLLDERMERLFASYDGFIESRLQGNPLTKEQKLVLSYLMKSEWANENLRYTILLTSDNNHFEALRNLEKAGLISKHSAGTNNAPIYVADRVLMKTDYLAELRALFGTGFDATNLLSKQILGVVYRFNHFSKQRDVSAKQASYSLWYEGGHTSEGIEQFDAFYRKIRRAFNKLVAEGLLERKAESRGYLLRRDYLETHLV